MTGKSHLIKWDFFMRYKYCENENEPQRHEGHKDLTVSYKSKDNFNCKPPSRLTPRPLGTPLGEGN